MSELEHIYFVARKIRSFKMNDLVVVANVL